MKKITLLLNCIIFITLSIHAQSHISTQSHQAQVNQVILSTFSDDYGPSYFSAGDDGFIVKWAEDNQGEHYQLSDVGIKLITCSPTENLIAVYESDGGSVNRVSVWDWKNLTRKYQKKFSDSVTSLSFSANGTYLIAGTATVDGVVFIKTNTGAYVNKVKANTGIVNYTHTSKTEKTCVTYSPTGNLAYYNLQNGSLKQRYSIMQGLTQTLMYNNDIFLAGVKDNSIYIINAYKGNTVASIPANNPIILSTESDFNLYYLEYDGRNNYEIKMIESKDTNSVSNPRSIKTMRGPRGESVITVGTKDGQYAYFGSRNGALYKTEIESTITTENLSELTEDTYSKIYGMAAGESDFFFLTADSIYKTSFDTGIVDKVIDSGGETQITTFKDNQVLLWSKGTRNSVNLMDLDKKTSVRLFTPKNNIQSLNICGDYIVEIESNSAVNLYDMQKKIFKEVYTGTGIQDAVMTNDGMMYIAKSSSTNPKVPILKVNPETLETIPVNVKGNVCYALSTNGTTIYGINLIADEDSGALNTYVFSYNTKSNQMTNLLKFSNEDSEAFTYLNGNNLFTNIGKNKVYCYNLNTKKRFSYNRSASIPQSICQNQKRAVILNYNGSISWVGTTDSKILADWYLTKDNQWYEF
ncbi:MAG: hypothetical protein IJ688_09980 [Treponema sp.]|nr:hypothetical protein [Treponema sp.]